MNKNNTNGIFVSLDELIEKRALARDFTLDNRRMSNAVIDGNSRSARRGRGMEFAEVRPYYAGDDVRNIDWRVTARTQETYTKLFQEEKERPVYILTDQRTPMFFGSRLQFKSVLAADLAAFISWCALKNNDRIGALVFSETQQSDLRAKRGKHSVLHFLRSLTEFNQKLTTKDAKKHGLDTEVNTLSTMLLELRRITRPGSLVYIISDFHDVTEDCTKSLSIISRHSDVTMMHVSDPLEKKLPHNMFLDIARGQDKLSMNTGDKRLKHQFETQYQQTIAQLTQTAHRSKAHLCQLTSSLPLTEQVHALFRSSRRRGGKR